MQLTAFSGIAPVSTTSHTTWKTTALTREKHVPAESAKRHAPCCRKAPHAHLRGWPKRVPLPNAGAGSKTCYKASQRHPELKILHRIWEPRGEAKAGMLIVPGLQWHSGWFSTIALPLVKDGVRVVSLDPLSTGRSDDLRGVRGLITCIEDHIDDLKAAVDELEKSLPAKAPLFVLGESSGGLSACSMCLCDGVSERISKWILCAPALQVAPELLPPKFVQNIVRKIGMRFPAMSFPGEAISGETWDAAFGDDVSAELGRKDEYVLYKTPLRMGTAVSSLDAMDRVESALENGTMKMKDVLVLHNRVDCRTLYGGSKQFVERVVGRAELEDPGGCAHQLFQEQSMVSERVVERIVKYVQEAIP